MKWPFEKDEGRVLNTGITYHSVLRWLITNNWPVEVAINMSQYIELTTIFQNPPPPGADLKFGPTTFRLITPIKRETFINVSEQERWPE